MCRYAPCLPGRAVRINTAGIYSLITGQADNLGRGPSLIRFIPRVRIHHSWTRKPLAVPAPQRPDNQPHASHTVVSALCAIRLSVGRRLLRTAWPVGDK